MELTIDRLPEPLQLLVRELAGPRPRHPIGVIMRDHIDETVKGLSGKPCLSPDLASCCCQELCPWIILCIIKLYMDMICMMIIYI